MAHRLIAVTLLVLTLAAAPSQADDRRPLTLPGGIPAGVGIYLRPPFCSSVGRVDIEAGAGILSDAGTRLGLLFNVQSVLARQCPGITKLTFSGWENGVLVYAGMMQHPWEEEVALYAP
ncbi:MULTISPECIES: hypothetical protein [unclassified Azospirillum]|uniref:hypothetical protein n=1 Tax=unclassified Azospirillum TaxID=2630922 RepID=UPI000B657028|nr:MULTISPECIES: hypothetical protein [unclassified Azospirillum]SNS23251.1 hypothetical protein SAMN05880556_10373 [Azospirillum sp. RU38E]SNS41388.1 hypothetical protein SAMN05880591_10373 [Azospirillum sp. RU37A]